MVSKQCSHCVTIVKEKDIKRREIVIRKEFVITVIWLDNWLEPAEKYKCSNNVGSDIGTNKHDPLSVGNINEVNIQVNNIPITSLAVLVWLANHFIIKITQILKWNYWTTFSILYALIYMHRGRIKQQQWISKESISVMFIPHYTRYRIFFQKPNYNRNKYFTRVTLGMSKQLLSKNSSRSIFTYNLVPII